MMDKILADLSGTKTFTESKSTTPPEALWSEADSAQLPPPGTTCEYTKPDGYKARERVWFWCYVVAHDQGGAVIRTEKGQYHLRKKPEYVFRPLKTTNVKEPQ